MMQYRNVRVLVPRWGELCPKSYHCRYLNEGVKASAHGPEEVGDGEEESQLPFEWYKKAYVKLLKMSHALRHFDQVDGRVLYIEDDSNVTDDRIIREMQIFKSIGKSFIGSPATQRALLLLLRNQCPLQPSPSPCFSKQQERKALLLNSLTRVCDFLFVSAQQRKLIRLVLCRQITQQHIWRNTLEQVLRNLQSEMHTFRHRKSPTFLMAEQIVSSCVKFLDKTKNNTPSQDIFPSWMQLNSSTKMAPEKMVELRRWEEVTEMFGDLTECLVKEERLASHLVKIEAMKEGLYQIKDVIIEREIGYKEMRHQDCLARRKLSMSLGHSSKCLFTLLLNYLYGTVRDIEVEACGLYGSVTSGQGVLICAGKVLTSDDEKMVLSGVKQLDRALGLFRFVWETANMKSGLELQGHLWSIGAKERSFRYKGNAFFVHAFKL